MPDCSHAYAAYFPESTRRNTFTEGEVKWPHPPTFLATPKTLAEAGLFFTPESGRMEDGATCFMCLNVFSNWKPDDDPHQVHLSVNPSCSWARARCSVEAHRVRPGGIDFSFPNAESAPGSATLEAARRATFGAFWPHDRVAGPHTTHSADMARAGFIYAGDDDTVLCPYCNTELHIWDLEDDVRNEHYRRKPFCAFFRPLLGSEPKDRSEPKSSSADVNSSADEGEAPVVTKKTQAKLKRRLVVESEDEQPNTPQKKHKGKAKACTPKDRREKSKPNSPAPEAAPRLESDKADFEFQAESESQAQAQANPETEVGERQTAQVPQLPLLSSPAFEPFQLRWSDVFQFVPQDHSPAMQRSSHRSPTPARRTFRSTQQSISGMIPTTPLTPSRSGPVTLSEGDDSLDNVLAEYFKGCAERG